MPYYYMYECIRPYRGDTRGISTCIHSFQLLVNHGDDEWTRAARAAHACMHASPPAGSFPCIWSVSVLVLLTY